MNKSPQGIRDFVLSLDLPEAEPRFEAAAAVEFSADREVVAVGSQLAEFTDAVPTELRPLISNSLLLAQLASNKAAAAAPTVFDWHKKYTEVLSNIGWQVADSEAQVQQVSNQNLDVHEAIIPVLTTLLGPAVAASSLVISVLRGLQEMDKSTPWIALFDRSSQHASGAKFQISLVDVDRSGTPTIKLLAFAVQAERTITQVLFFKFSSHRAEMRTSTSTLSASVERLQTDKAVIAGRVQSFIAEFVQNVAI